MKWNQKILISCCVWQGYSCALNDGQAGFALYSLIGNLCQNSAWTGDGHRKYAPHFRMKTVKILLKTWVRLFWTIQKINQRDSNEENVFSFLDDIMKSGIHKNIESSWIGFQIDLHLTTLSANEIEGSFITYESSIWKLVTLQVY